MLIERKPLSELADAPYNPRVTLKPGMDGYDRLKRSLDEFELVQPPVWNRRSGYLVGGHQRVAMLRETGRTEVDCVVVDLPDDRERALNVALNNDAVGGTWDTPKLLDLLDGLTADTAADETLTGFSADDLAELLLSPADLPPTEPAAGPSAGDDPVAVSLDVPRDRWESVQTWVDALLADEPGVRVHVT